MSIGTWIAAIVKPIVEEVVKDAVDTVFAQVSKDLVQVKDQVDTILLSVGNDLKKDVTMVGQGIDDALAKSVLDSEKVADQLINWLKAKLPFPFNQ